MKVPSQNVPVRMPKDLFDKLTQLSEVTKMSKPRLVELSVRALVKIAKQRGGAIFHSYSAHFAKETIDGIKAKIEQHES